MSIENPSVPLSQFDEDDATSLGLRSPSSISGISVNRIKALGYSAVWRAVNLISTDVAKIPLMVFERLAQGGKERAKMHPAFKILHRKPNPEMTAFAFKQTLTAHVLLHGNAYAYIERDGNGEVTGLFGMDPIHTYPVLENNRLVYVHDFENGDMAKFSPGNILHLKGLGYDGLVGYSVLRFAKDSLGIGISARDYQGRFFRNNAMPGVLLTHPSQISKDAAKRLKDSWNQMHAGVKNSHKTAILEEGMGVEAMSIPAKDAELLGTREFEIREIANFFGVPPHKLGDPTRTAFASLEQENQSYLDEALDGRLVMWEEECTDKLTSEGEKMTDSHFCEFVRESVIRVDQGTMVNTLTAEVNNGLLSLDEARAIRNRPALPDGLGAGFRIPLNLAVLGEDPEPDPEPQFDPPDPEPAPEPEQEDDSDPMDDARALVAHRRLVVDAVRRVINRISIQAERGARIPDRWLNWVDGIERAHKSAVTRTIEPTIAAFCTVIGGDAATITESATQTLFGVVREGALEACECQPADLADSVRSWSAAMQADLPDNLADQVVEWIALESKNERKRMPSHTG